MSFIINTESQITLFIGPDEDQKNDKFSYKNFDAVFEKINSSETKDVSNSKKFDPEANIPKMTASSKKWLTKNLIEVDIFEKKIN